MKLQNSFILLFTGALLFTGCATKIDLYKYKDVSSVQILDDNKANHKVLKPKLSQNIVVDSGKWSSFSGGMRDHFLAKNDKDSIFIIDENGSYKLGVVSGNGIYSTLRKFYHS